MIIKFDVHAVAGDGAPAHLRDHLDGLTSWRQYHVEFADAPTAEQVGRIAGALGDPILQRVDVDEPVDATRTVTVAYKRGIVDNENDTVVEVCRVLGADATAAKVATAYASDDPALAEVVAEHACNANIEELHRGDPDFGTLALAGGWEPMETVDLRGLDGEALAAIGTGNGRTLDLDQMRAIRSIQEAAGLDHVSDALLEALDARWSDHCAHTTWKRLGRLLHRLIDAAKATENPNIVSMFHDNAGVWDLYDDHCVAVKAETHNGPSAVSAYFGQLTKIGGVLRDILGTGTGADPIGVFEYTATGLPDQPSPVAGRPSPRRIANETIRAVKEYGNTFGVPMMSSHMTFHPAYRAKPFALGGSIGLIPRAAAQRGEPEPGDLVVLIGGLTGNDGIHGASASSAGAVAMDATSVQIGSPLEEIKFREAIVDLRDAGLLRAVTDLGAAGINSAVGEMGDPCGVWINTALVPLKTAGLPMWRILLSESQERMLLAVAPADLDEARAVLERHEVRAAVIGRFTGEGRYCVVHDEAVGEADVLASTSCPDGVAEVGFDLPYDLLDWSPDSVTVGPPPATPPPGAWPEAPVDDDVVAAVVSDLEVADQTLAAKQYDSSVQGRSTYGPLIGPDDGVATGFWAGRPLLERRHGVVFSTGFDPWLFDVDPVLAARQAVLSALTAQAVAGVARTDVCLCDNFYTPHLTEDFDRWLVAMVDELAALSVALGTPFISGKDSSAGSSHTDEGIVSVPPAVFVSALGKVPDVDALRLEPLTAPGHALVLVGPRTPSPAGTAAARALGWADVGGIDEVDVVAARRFLDAVAALPADVARSGVRIGPGGVLAAAWRAGRAGGVGVELDGTSLAALFAEHRCGALLEVPDDAVADLPGALDAVVVGRTVAEPGVHAGGRLLTTPAVHEAWASAYPEALS